MSIARGLLRDAPVLILDEPTAALDPETERGLLDALTTTRRPRFTIVIAHRVSTIERADRIVFLDEGRVVETGSPAVLATRHGPIVQRTQNDSQGTP